MTVLNDSGCKIEISADNSNWVDISGYASNVEPGPMTRLSGEQFNFGADKGEVTTGKLAVRDLAVTILYTEGATDPFKKIRDLIENNTDYYLRWSPQGGNSGDFLFTSDVGKFTEMNDPTADASSADGEVLVTTFRTPFVTQSSIA